MAKIIDREDGRSLIIPVDQDRFLSYPVLKQYFTGALGLVYKLENEEVAILFDESMMKLVPPANGWDRKEFYVVRASSRPPSRVDIEGSAASRTSFPEIDGRDILPTVDRCRKFMLFSLITEVSAGVFEDGSIRSCVTVVSSRFAFMAGHCLPKGYPMGKIFKVYDSSGNSYNVKLVLLERYEESGDDFAIVEIQNGEFPFFPLVIKSPEQGNPYFILGYDGEYPDADLSYFKGTVRNVNMYVSKNYIIGSPGTTSGCSGGGVFSMNGDLYGICVSGLLVTGSNLATLDFHFQTLRLKLGEPSYSHIVPGHYLVARIPNRKRKCEEIDTSDSSDNSMDAAKNKKN